MNAVRVSAAVATALFTSASALALPWESVVPHGAELCDSDTTFSVAKDTQANIRAAQIAKSQLCKTIRSGR